MRTELFDYFLPTELIAQIPEPRGESRLLVLHKESGRIEHRRFSDVLDYLAAGDTLVLNDTRVTARRLEARRESGESAEVLLLRPVDETRWEALVKPGKSLRPGKTVTLVGTAEGEPDVTAQVVATTPEGGRLLEFSDRAVRDSLAHRGTTPLPPYIHHALPASEEARYQTVYARQDGSAAAPTAGLHFTPELFTRTEILGVRRTEVTLHIGVGTFRPVRSEEIEAHEMHSEWISVSEEAANAVNNTSGRVVAVGTTSVRALESAASVMSQEISSSTNKRVGPYIGDTCLFITPGYRFRAVDALITNFHMPRSTLLMLICALAGREAVLHAYEEAVRERYRFFSFGDAMLIV